MNTGYLIYQAERPRSAAEQRQVDIAHAELARSARRRWHALTAPLRSRRLRGRQPGLGQPGLGQPGVGQPGVGQTGLPVGYQDECLSESLTGQRA